MLSLLTVIPRAVQKWQQDRTLLMGAALAFYIVISLTPVLVVAVGISGILFEQAAVKDSLVSQIQLIAGEDAAGGLRFLLQNIRRPTTQELIPTAIGLVVLVFGAANVFFQMQTTLNIIFKANGDQKYGLPFMTYFERYGLSVLMLIGVALLLIASVLSEAVYSDLFGFFNSDLGVPLEQNTWRFLKFMVTAIVSILLFSFIYKGVPDIKIKWINAFKGSVIAAILFGLGILLLGLYFSSNVIGSAYGAASSIVVALLWVYFAAQVFLFGAQVVAVEEKPNEDINSDYI